MAIDTTTFAYALKTRYPTFELQNLVYKDNPFFAMVPKSEEFDGANLSLPVRYADTQGRSATFSVAQANKGAHQGKQFLITRVRDYALASIGGEVIRASKRTPGAFLPAAEAEMSSAMNNLNRSIGVSMYKAGTGSIGQVGSVAGNVITLSQIQDVTNFEVNMHLVASATDGAALRGAPDVATVTAVDRDLGLVSYSGTIAGLAANDFIAPQGDAANGGPLLRMAGTAAWLPTTAPTSTPFFGVDRSADVTRLGGIRQDISGYPLVEGIVRAGNRVAREGGSPSHLFIGFDQYTNLINEVGAKVVYVDKEVADIGFQGVRLFAGKGTVEVYPDQNCPHNLGYMLQMDTWKFFSLGPAPDFLDEDGLKMLRDSGSDSYEVRMGLYGNLTCNAPGYNAVLTMPP